MNNNLSTPFKLTSLALCILLTACGGGSSSSNDVTPEPTPTPTPTPTAPTQGEIIGGLGTAKVNGDYPPHLHFQIILDIENYQGDYPGVASLNTLAFYKTNCPNPNLLLV